MRGLKTVRYEVVERVAHITLDRQRAAEAGFKRAVEERDGRLET